MAGMAAKNLDAALGSAARNTAIHGIETVVEWWRSQKDHLRPNDMVEPLLRSQRLLNIGTSFEVAYGTMTKRLDGWQGRIITGPPYETGETEPLRCFLISVIAAFQQEDRMKNR